jgi:regulator of protease activity HflC (stomatin/prohibitin superfamily)
VPQARAAVVERLGRYQRTLDPGSAVVRPFVDRLKPLIDLREQVVSFAPQPVITEGNLVVQIDTVVYFQVTDPRAISYEVANPLQAIEQLTITTLRNVVGGITLEDALTSRDHINGQLQSVLDDATGKWGMRVNRVELKSIEPPDTIQQAMEKQMRAERDRRAAILNAEGVKQAQILTAEGERQSVVLRAQGARESAILRAEGEAQAIGTMFQAIHDGRPDPQLLSYQYLQMLPRFAQGEANKVFLIPSEFSQAFGGLHRPLERAGSRTDPAEETALRPADVTPQRHGARCLMTSVKMFVIGALLGTLFQATFLGAISHLLVIALAVIDAGALALAGRRRGLGRSSRIGPDRPAGS